MDNGSMMPSLPHWLPRICIVLACLLLIGGALLGEEPLLREEVPASRAMVPTSLDLRGRLSVSADRPEALVGLSSLGVPTATPTAAPFPEWVQTRRAAILWSGHQPLATVVAKLPDGYPLKVNGVQDGRFLVFYGGGGRDDDASEGWLDQTEIASAGAPKWVATRWESVMRANPAGSSAISAKLPAGAVLESIEDRGRDLRVFYLGDGRTSEPVEGWVKASDLGAAGAMLAAESRGMRRLSRAEAASLKAGEGVWMKVAFRTQLDGSPAAEANCGPASIGMALEYFHSIVSTAELRQAAHRLQGTWGDDSGFGIEFLGRLAEQFGLRSHDLYAGTGFKRWGLEDLKNHLSQGHLVVPELRFRYMPGRGKSDSWDDHYVVISGMRGDDFIYNDSVDVDGPGYGRVMSSDSLTRAWGGSDFPFAAFALSKP